MTSNPLRRLVVALALGVAAPHLCRAQSATRPAPAPTAEPLTVRPTRRPVLSDEEYKKLAGDLRDAYLKPADEWPAAELDEGVRGNFHDLRTLPSVEFPADNPYSKEKADLGKQLFFDPRLSASGAVACASCHDPDLAWTDGRTVSFGHARQAGERNAPPIMNAAFNRFFFWDGRAITLEMQAVTPIVDDREMHATRELVERNIGAVPEYREKFKQIFGDTDEPDMLVSMERVGMAIATFERTVVGGHSRFDAFVSGKNAQALSDAAVRGLHLFRTTARCINCHNGPNFTDGQFHNIGLTYYGRQFQDLGRYVVTKKPEDVGRFKTPGLRNVARTGPYMHNGFFELEGVLNIYNAGGANPRRTAAQKDDPLFPVTDKLLKPLGLNAHDKEDLIAFLDSLSEPKLRVRPPTLPGLSEGPKRSTPTSRPAGPLPAGDDVP
jgi:cytochrome c peroxidase